MKVIKSSRDGEKIIRTLCKYFCNHPNVT